MVTFFVVLILLGVPMAAQADPYHLMLHRTFHQDAVEQPGGPIIHEDAVSAWMGYSMDYNPSTGWVEAFSGPLFFGAILPQPIVLTDQGGELHLTGGIFDTITQLYLETEPFHYFQSTMGWPSQVVMGPDTFAMVNADSGERIILYGTYVLAPAAVPGPVAWLALLGGFGLMLGMRKVAS